MPAIFPLFAILVVFVFISMHASANQRPKRRRYTDYNRSGGSRDGYRGSSSGKDRDYARGGRGGGSSSSRGDRGGRGSSRDRY
ncbi:MAG: hypothetical protein AAF810_05805 [Cyanobacteria bacterium P01_D01_bin.36]